MFHLDSRNCKWRQKFRADSQSETETGSRKHVCLYYCDDQTAVQRHSGNRQRHKSLYTGFYSDTFRDGSCVKRAGRYKIGVYVNGQWGYIVVDGVYWFWLHPCTCVILDGTTGNRIVTNTPWNVIKSASDSAFLLINIYIYFFSNTGHIRP